METPNLWTRSQLQRPGGMRVCPAGLPVKAHAPAASQVSNIRLWPLPRVDIGRDEMDQGRRHDTNPLNLSEVGCAASFAEAAALDR